MTWALAKVTKIFAICMSLRNSLKILKKMSREDDTITEHQKRSNLEHCSGVLMFWTIFGVFVVCEQYFEFFVRWFPLYYYVKTFFILFMAFPRLRFTEYVFYRLLVPAVEFVHANVGHIMSMPPLDVMMCLVFELLFVCFPMINHPDDAQKSITSGDFISMTEGLLIDVDSECDEVNVDDMWDEGGEEEVVDVDGMLNIEEVQKEAQIEINEEDSADLSINLDDSCDPMVDDLESSAEHINVQHEDSDYSLSFSFDESGTLSDDDGFSLSLPAVLGEDHLEEDAKRVEQGEEERCAVEGIGRSEAVYESPSRVLRSFRKLLTGDSNTRLSDTVFNLDLNSPPPNTQYRHRRQSSSPPSCSTLGGHRDRAGRTSVFGLGDTRRSSRLEAKKVKKTGGDVGSCYSPLHSSHDKENIFEVDEVPLKSSSDPESHITLRSRRQKPTADDFNHITRNTIFHRSEAKSSGGGYRGERISEKKDTGRFSRRLRGLSECKAGLAPDDKSAVRKRQKTSESGGKREWK